MIDWIWTIIGAMSIGQLEPMPLSYIPATFDTEQACEERLSIMLDDGFKLRRDNNGDLVAFYHSENTKTVYRCVALIRPE